MFACYAAVSFIDPLLLWGGGEMMGSIFGFSSRWPLGVFLAAALVGAAGFITITGQAPGDTWRWKRGPSQEPVWTILSEAKSSAASVWEPTGRPPRKTRKLSDHFSGRQSRRAASWNSTTLSAKPGSPILSVQATAKGISAGG